MGQLRGGDPRPGQDRRGCPPSRLQAPTLLPLCRHPLILIRDSQTEEVRRVRGRGRDCDHDRTGSTNLATLSSDGPGLTPNAAKPQFLNAYSCLDLPLVRFIHGRMAG